jgi:hypothetical protein
VSGKAEGKDLGKVEGKESRRNRALVYAKAAKKARPWGLRKTQDSPEAIPQDVIHKKEQSLEGAKESPEDSSKNLCKNHSKVTQRFI